MSEKSTSSKSRGGMRSFFSSREIKRQDRSKDQQSVPKGKEKTKPVAMVSRKPNKVQGKSLKPSGPPAGNQQGFTSKGKKENSFVNFGPIIKEFLSSKFLVDKEVSVHYKEATDSTEISLTYTVLLDNGVTKSVPVTQSLSDYMGVKDSLLRKQTKDNAYSDLVGRLFIRLGVNLLSAKPGVDPKSVCSFIKRHLSPFENQVIDLTNSDWDLLDVAKLDHVNKLTHQTCLTFYADVKGDRTGYLYRMISNTQTEADSKIGYPNWPILGHGPCNKGYLLANYKVAKPLTGEQEAALRVLASAGEEEDTQGE